jgi:pSer/pThr/pTyr-binding forkhead associated (FHA) protein
MRVPDISVSRYHAHITYKNDHFYIQDNDSKFGTLLLLKEPLVIDPSAIQDDEPITIQVGRTISTISCQ